MLRFVLNGASALDGKQPGLQHRQVGPRIICANDSNLHPGLTQTPRQRRPGLSRSDYDSVICIRHKQVLSDTAAQTIRSFSARIFVVVLALDCTNDNKTAETIGKPGAFLSTIESCWIGYNESTIEDEPDKEERLGSGYAEPILSLACPLFSRRVFVVPTLPVASTGTATRTCRNQLSKGSDDLDAAYCRVRELSESLCETLQPEDCVVQTVPEVSPTKWHLAH